VVAGRDSPDISERLGCCVSYTLMHLVKFVGIVVAVSSKRRVISLDAVGALFEEEWC
jgi:hypothetical protein